MATVASPLRQFYEWSTRDSGRAVALSWHPAPPRPVERWSYRRLWLAAVGAAAKLRACGAVPSDPESASSVTIGVAVDEGVELVVAFLAVALAGAAIVPFSGADPPPRIASVLADAGCRAVVVDSRGDRAGAARVEEGARQSGRTLTLVEAADLILASREERDVDASKTNGDGPRADPDPGDPRRVSHVAFTSGSAGKPRGCVCAYESLAHYCHGKNARMDVRRDSTVLLASAHTFDPCLGDVFATLAAGATLAIAPRARLAASLGACLAESRATHALCTPTMLGGVPAAEVEGAARSLRVLALGGEPMSPALAGAWLPRVECLANAYGLTECGVYQTFSRVEHALAADQIGEPLGPGCRLLVAEPGDETVGGDGEGDGDAASDADALLDVEAVLRALVPVDELRLDGAENGTGDGSGRMNERLFELWIAGPQVGLGYARDAAASRRRFFVHPRTGERFFRTGDLVRVEDAPRGKTEAETKDSRVSLRFAGRREAREFKLNGRRVDAREIERAVLSSGLVSSCACSVSESVAGDDVLTAHVVLRDDDAAAAKPRSPTRRDGDGDGDGDGEDSAAALLDDCARVALEVHAGCYLPPSTVPRRFLAWAAFPKTASGKLDRARLARAGVRGASEASFASGRDAAREHEKPLPGTTARLVADVWGETLGVASSSIRVSDDFGALGGNSVSALRAARTLRARLERAAPRTRRDVAGRLFGRGAARGGGEADEDAGRGLGLREGEAAASFREEEDRACAFDVVAGPLSPAEILRRPTLAAYASFLDASGLGTQAGASRDDDAFFAETDALASESESPRRELAALVQACARGRADVARALLRAGADPNLAWARDGFAPLHVAAAGGASEARKMAVVEALLGAGADARARTAAGTTAAHLAAARGERALLELLLVRGCDPGAADGDKQTVAHLAARRGAFGAAETAALACAPLRTARGGLESWDAWRRTPADWALANGASDALLALRDAGARVRALGSRVASAAAATRDKARDVSEWKTAKARSVLATLVAETRRFVDVPANGRVVARKKADDPADAKENESEEKRESEARAIEAEILAAGRAAATLKALVCANAFNRDAARALGAMAPLVAMVASVGSSPSSSPKRDSRTGSRLESSALREARIRAATDAAGALRNLAYANAANRAAAIEAGAVDALEAALRGAPPEAAPDGPRRRLAFASASALANLKPRGREAAR